MKAALAGVLMVLAILSLDGSAARAEAPSRTGWWNTATVSGSALPSTTGADDLHIARGPSGALAFAAVSYQTESFSSATLTLHAVARSEVGTAALLACPTRDDSWKSGGDQPIATAPGFDCAGRAVTAVVGSDSTGTTLTFLLDPSVQLAPGTTSLALVPADGQTPFSLDLKAPGEQSLSVVPAVVGPGPSAAPTPEPSQTAVPPAPTVPVVAPPLTGLGGPPPVTSAPLASALPTVASPAPLAASPVSHSVTPRLDRRSAGVLLVLVLGAFAWAMAEHRSGPLQLLGGRARAGEVVVPTREGGIGRFRRPRSAGPRRLL